MVLVKIVSYGLWLNKEKCSFRMSKVEYLGHKISTRGLQTNESKVASVLKAPKPMNLQEFCLFLGLVNYYVRFIQDLATTGHPLNKLLERIAHGSGPRLTIRLSRC